MSHSSGVVTKLYPESGDTPASSSVVTWRVVVSIINNFSSTLRSISLARNNGVKLEVKLIICYIV